MSRKALIIIIGIGVVVVLMIGWWLFGEREITNAPPDGDTVVAFGDSLVVGVGDDDASGFVSDIERRLDIDVINEGEAGDTTADGLNRLNDVIAHEPDIVLVSLGGNDYLSDIPIETTRANFQSIIEQLHGSGAVVVLLGVRGGILADPYDSMFADLADRYGTAYIPNILDNIVGEPDLMHDRVHPNAEGYEKIAERVAPRLRALLRSER